MKSRSMKQPDEAVPAPSQAVPCRARVARIDDDGAVVVVPEGGAGEWRCDVLETSPLAPLVVAAGDLVLVLPAQPESAAPVVLGRVRRGAAADPGRVVLESARELVLRCGKGSIVLRADGRIAITGLDIASVADRRQRIKGGSVEIN